MSPILLVADIDESGFLRRFHPNSVHRTEETSTGLRAMLSVRAPACGRLRLLLARARACPGSLPGGSGATEATVAMELAEDWLVESLRL